MDYYNRMTVRRALTVEVFELHGKWLIEHARFIFLRLYTKGL